jgi:23S rRNA A2030 N6-methylase RlmJ
VTVIWYPLKERSTHAQWKHQLRKLGIPKFLNVEHWLYDTDQPGIYNGAGLYRQPALCLHAGAAAFAGRLARRTSARGA